MQDLRSASPARVDEADHGALCEQPAPTDSARLSTVIRRTADEVVREMLRRAVPHPSSA